MKTFLYQYVPHLYKAKIKRMAISKNYFGIVVFIKVKL